MLNHPDLSPHEELTEDLMSIIHVFPRRLSGLRQYNKNLETIRL
ncbi:inosine-5-monophosphate dehydrogenase [Lacticaseibacillus rhamnosus]|nr:inosine-5-monophosphate dehydrogenase [Lacticaseibacillus rhamnosus]MCT3182262.1 inosine-5-monophosphate dehydrogenase [Lacticaseibacillus rhamnosus]